MESLLEKLINLLDEETGLYRSLHHVVESEKFAVLDANVDALITSSGEKEILLRRARLLERQRCELMVRLAGKLNRPARELTLNRLTRLTPEPWASRLKSIGGNLRTLVRRVRKIDSGNQTMVRFSLDFVRSSLTLLNNMMAGSSRYCRTGKMYNGHANGKVLRGVV
ncbi:MAG: flagellar protein FlgN [Desulfobacterales bacterium]|nr:flagellar protein FlgN [Desulfobacterales bacterium]